MRGLPIPPYGNYLIHSTVLTYGEHRDRFRCCESLIETTDARRTTLRREAEGRTVAVALSAT
jgi:hypothetical protein